VYDLFTHFFSLGSANKHAATLFDVDAAGARRRLVLRMHDSTMNTTDCAPDNTSMAAFQLEPPIFTHIALVKVIVLSAMFTVSLASNSAVLVCIICRWRRRHLGYRVVVVVVVVGVVVVVVVVVVDVVAWATEVVPERPRPTVSSALIQLISSLETWHSLIYSLRSSVT